MQPEEWKQHPTIPGLWASSRGRIRRDPQPKNKNLDWPIFSHAGTAGTKMPNGYMQMNIDRKSRMVHRLVAEAFHGPAPFPKAVAMHLNHDKVDNRPQNLRWGTQRENLLMDGTIEKVRENAAKGRALVTPEQRREYSSLGVIALREKRRAACSSSPG